MKRAVTFWSESGGVGKTTLAVNTAAMLGRRGNDVLAIDLDPQPGSFTDHVGYDEYKTDKGDHFGDVLIKPEQHDITEHIHEVSDFDLIPAHEGLANLEKELISEGVRLKEYQLLRAIKPITDEYDYLILDPQASLSVLVDNAIVASRNVLIPIELNRKGNVSIDGLEETLDMMEESFQQIQDDFQLRIMAIIPNKTKDTNLAVDTRAELEQNNKPVTSFDIRERSILQSAWHEQQTLFEYAEREDTRVYSYAEDLFDQFEALAALVERGALTTAKEVEA